MEKKIKQIMLDLGADVCGIARAEDFADAPKGYKATDILNGCRAVVVFGKAIPKGVYEAAPQLVYTKCLHSCEEELDLMAFHGAMKLEKEFECLALPVPSDDPVELFTMPDGKERIHGAISLRHSAVLAGLGSLGKNGLLINEIHGNRLMLGAILTTLDLHADELVNDLCISGCTKCLNACPTGAICKDELTKQQVCRSFTYKRNNLGYSVTNCIICRKVCPLK